MVFWVSASGGTAQGEHTSSCPSLPRETAQCPWQKNADPSCRIPAAEVQVVAKDTSVSSQAVHPSPMGAVPPHPRPVDADPGWSWDAEDASARNTALAPCRRGIQSARPCGARARETQPPQALDFCTISSGLVQAPPQPRAPLPPLIAKTDPPSRHAHTVTQSGPPTEARPSQESGTYADEHTRSCKEAKAFAATAWVENARRCEAHACAPGDGGAFAGYVEDASASRDNCPQGNWGQCALSIG